MCVSLSIFQMNISWLFLLLLLSGDIELNPGPPRRNPGGVPGGGPKKEEVSKEGQLDKLESKVSCDACMLLWSHISTLKYY